jgi:hypothetical protein
LRHGVSSTPLQTQPLFPLSAFKQLCHKEIAQNTDNSLDNKFDRARRI